MYNGIRAVIIATAYLVVYIVLIEVKASQNLLGFLFMSSPFLVIWMVYNVLKDRRFDYPELSPQQEWGYADQPPQETICAATCCLIMEPFEIEIDTDGISKTLMVYTNPIEGSYDIFEDKHRLGVIYRDQEKGGIWCSKNHLPMELINLMGSRIDAYEG